MKRIRDICAGAFGGSGFVSVLSIVALLSVTLNFVLAEKLRNALRPQYAKPGGRVLAIGTAVPPIEAERLGGQREVISYVGVTEPTVLYVFTPSCIWCARNFANFQAISEGKKAAYRIVGLSLSKDGLSRYAATHGLNIPIYAGLSPETQRIYMLGATPETIVVSPQGKVLENWVGAYVGKQKDQIEKFFNLRLPGLKEVAKPPEQEIGTGDGRAEGEPI